MGPVRVPRSTGRDAGLQSIRSSVWTFGRWTSVIVKSAWLQETDLGGAKRNVVEFILDTRERLRHALDVAN